MFPQDIKTWLVYITLAVVLGAIGSGLWEYLLKPTLRKSSSVFLKIITLGLKSSKDKIYREIASRPKQRPVFLILMTIIMAIFALLGNTAASFTSSQLDTPTAKIDKAQFTINSSTKEQLQKLEEMIAAEKAAKKEIARLESEIAEREKEMVTFLFLTTLLLATYMLTSYAKCAYIHNATCHFDQVLAICSPYIDKHEKAHILSNFARIKSKKDYEKIIKELKDIANQNNINDTPYFLIF